MKGRIPLFEQFLDEVLPSLPFARAFGEPSVAWEYEAGFSHGDSYYVI